MKRLLLPLMLGMLTGCSGPSAPGEAYTITTVLPNPALPGGEVTLYGHFPAQPTVLLGEVSLPGTPGLDSVRVTLPRELPAGEHSLVLQGSDVQAELTVTPRVDGVRLTSGGLRVQGAGWVRAGSLLPDTRVVVNGLPQVPTLDGLDLTVPVTTSLNGALDVIVSVGPHSSAATRVVKEAATVQGRVRLPAQGQTVIRSLQARGAPAPRSLIVRHSTSLTLPELPGLQDRQDLPLLHATRLTFQTSDQATSARAVLLPLPEVQAVTADAEVQLDGTDAVPLALPGAPGLGEQWFWPLLGVTEAWTHTRGQGVTVAVVDTGVALDHPDLQGNLLPGLDFLDGSSPQDTVGHGTHVAGLIAANGQVKGAAPEAWLVPVRVLDAVRGGSAFVVAQGILWTAGLLPERPNPHPADIINLSLGTTEPSPELENAVRRAQEAGVLVVAATGNNSGSVNYPAAYPGVLAVTSVSGPRLTYQPGYADSGPGTRLAAYGGDLTADQDANRIQDGVLSTDLSSDGTPGYGLRQGTSMAAPQVAGIAALALSSGTPRARLLDTLLNTGTDLGVMGDDENYGRGLVNAWVASPGSPRSYVLALDARGQTLGWTLVQSDGTFTLTNLPAGTVTLRAASDGDGDGVLGEAGELLSESAPLSLTAGQTNTAPDLTLNPTDGRTPYRL